MTNMLHKNKIQIEREARAWLAKGKWDKAINAYRHLLDVKGKDPMIYNLIGDLYVKMNNFDGALSEFIKAIDLYAKEGLFENSIAVCKKVLRLDMDTAEIYFKLAELYAQLGFSYEALNSLMIYGEKDTSRHIIKRSLNKYAQIMTRLSNDGANASELKKVYLKIGHNDSELDQLMGIASDKGRKPSINKAERAKSKLTKDKKLSTRQLSTESPAKKDISESSNKQPNIGETKPIMQDNRRDISDAINYIDEASKNESTSASGQSKQRTDHYKLEMIYKELSSYQQAIEELKQVNDKSTTQPTNQLDVRKFSGFFFSANGSPTFAIGEFNPVLDKKGLSESESAKFNYHLNQLYEILTKHKKSSKQSSDEQDTNKL